MKTFPASARSSSPEMDLLCACVRPVRPDAAAAEHLRGRSVDWPRFMALANNHHVVTLVHEALKAAAATAPVPAAWLAQLRSASRSIAAYDLRATALLIRIQTSMRAQGIALVPVKGPALAALAYGDVVRRQFEDLDLIVARKDLLRAVAWLERDGFGLRELSARVSRAQYLATLQGWSLHKPGGPPIDLKPVLISHLFCGESSVDFMAAACRRLPLGERSGLDAPGPEAMLLAVCLDGAGEMWIKLSAVADVGALLVNHADRDWSKFLGEAAQRGQRRSLLVGACLAEDLLGVSLPEAFRAGVREDAPARHLAKEAAERLRSLAPRHTAIVRQSWFALRTRERLRDRLRFMYRLLFVPGAFDLAAFPLPGFLYPAQVLIRPLRLAWDALGRGGRHRRLTLPFPDEKVRSEAKKE